MRWSVLGLSMAVLGLAAAGEMPFDLTAPGGGQIHSQTQPGNRVVVTGDYWRLEFDLRNGGALDTIVFPHGSGKNVIFRINPGVLGMLAARYEVKETATGTTQLLSVGGLSDGTLTTQLNGYEYKIFEVSPKQ